MDELNDLYGQDILLDECLQPVVTENGEHLWTEGAQTVVQQIKLRLATPYNEDTQGGLFYDKEFYSLLYQFLREEDTPLNRDAIVVETINTINKDSRVDINETFAQVESKPDGSIQIIAEFKLLDEESPFNLVIEQGSDLSILIKDGNS